jgi:hypothetical protein
MSITLASFINPHFFNDGKIAHIHNFTFTRNSVITKKYYFLCDAKLKYMIGKLCVIELNINYG